MGSSMTCRTKGDEILLKISSKMASKLNVMNLQCLHSSAVLAPPAVALQDLAAKLAVGFRLKLESRQHGSD